jgi:hypothetical protein
MALLVVLSVVREVRVLRQAYLVPQSLMRVGGAAGLRQRELPVLAVLVAVALVLLLHLLQQELLILAVVEVVQEIIPERVALAVQA